MHFTGLIPSYPGNRAEPGKGIFEDLFYFERNHSNESLKDIYWNYVSCISTAMYLF